MTGIRRIHSAIVSLIVMMGLNAGCGLSTPPTITASRTFHAESTQLQARSNRVIVKFRASSSDSQVKSVSRFVSSSIPSLGLLVVNAGIKGANEQLSALSGAGVIEYSEPDSLVKTHLTIGTPSSSKQYGHRAIQLPAAWDATMGDPSVVVAVIDSGVDLDHPDLRDRLVPGISFIPGSKGPSDDHGHGTHVAGIIAGSGNNGQGILGVAPRCRLMPIKVLDQKGEGNTSDIVSGIVYAAEHGARILNLSLGGIGGGKALETAIVYAQRKGCVVVAAMGNEGANAQDYPASYPGVIAVGAVDDRDHVAEYSNFGRWISVVAPGTDIYSTMPTYHVTLDDEDPGADLRYGTLSGTSMATPYVAGVVALLCSARPGLTSSAIKSLLERSADDLGKSGYDVYHGFGRINAARALKLLP